MQLLLWLLVLEIAIRRSKVETWGTIFGKCCQLKRADDMVIMGTRLQEVEEVITPMAKQTNKVGLKINGEGGGGVERKLMTIILKAL
jgi:hypothetical protein